VIGATHTLPTLGVAPRLAGASQLAPARVLRVRAWYLQYNQGQMWLTQNCVTR
jgi:hypothetical protein